MAQPNPFDRFTSFTQLQSLDPDAPLPGAAVDAELNRVKSTLDQILANLQLIQRDDTQLANASVGFDQLKAEIDLGFNPPTDWAPDTQYFARDTVFYDAKFWRCEVTHVSTAVFEPAKFSVIADFTDATSEAQGYRDEAQAAQVAAEAAQAGAETAQTAAETAQGLSEGARDASEAHKVGAQAAQTASEAARDLALTYRNSAQAAQGAAEAARDDAQTSLDTFDAIWLGEQAADPATDLNGDPLTGGELYLNSVTKVARVYSSTSGWRDVGSSADVRTGTFTTDGSAGPYTLPAAPISKASVFINMNGLSVLRSDFEISGNELTFNVAPAAGYEVDAAVLGAVEIGVPSPETVGFSQLTTDTSELALIRQALTASGEKPFRWNHAWNPFMKLNTRAQAAYSANGYTLDRWYSSRSGAFGDVTREVLTRGEDGMPFEILHYLQFDVTTGSDYCRLEHRWPSARQFAGKTITIVFLARGVNPGGGSLLLSADQYFGAASATPTRFTVDSENIVLNPTWTIHAVKIDVPDIDGVDLQSDSYFSVRMGQGLDASTDAWRLNMTGFLVIEGDVRDEFTALGDVTRHYKGDEIEEHRCRVFCRSETNPLNAAGFYAVSGTVPSAPLRFEPAMLRAPNATITVPGSYAGGNGGSVDQISAHGCRIKWNATSTGITQWFGQTILFEAEV